MSNNGVNQVWGCVNTVLRALLMGLLIYCNCFCQCFVSLKVELKIDDVTDAYIDSSWTWQFKLKPSKTITRWSVRWYWLSQYWVVVSCLHHSSGLTIRMLNSHGSRDLVKVAFLNLFKKKNSWYDGGLRSTKFWLNSGVDISNWLYLGLSSFYDNEMWVTTCKTQGRGPWV